MLMKFSWFVFLIVLVACQMAPLYDRQVDNQLKSLTPEQLADLDEYFSHKLNEESLSKNLAHNLRYSNQNYMIKRDALWTTTEVLECVRCLKNFKDSSKLDLVTEMLNCYQRLKNNS